jgi:alcohol dehydrogenase class IV
LNAICLPAAMRFNEPAIGGALDVLREAMVTEDPIAKVEELAALAGFTRLRDLGVPQAELDAVADATAVRPGTRANPRPASTEEIAGLLRSIW